MTMAALLSLQGHLIAYAVFSNPARVGAACGMQAATAERKRAADLQLQASELAAKALEAAVRERCERVKEVDNVS